MQNHKNNREENDKYKYEEGASRRGILPSVRPELEVVSRGIPAKGMILAGHIHTNLTASRSAPGDLVGVVNTRTLAEITEILTENRKEYKE